MYFHFILFAFYFAFVAAQCSGGQVAMPMGSNSFAGVMEGAECFCGAPPGPAGTQPPSDDVCQNALESDDDVPFVGRGVMTNGRCDLQSLSGATVGVFRFVGDDDFSIGSCSEPVFDFGGNAGFDDFANDPAPGDIDADPRFSNACVCVDPCADEATLVNNGVGDCVCPSGQTDTADEGGSCVNIEFSSCTAPAASPDGCEIGQLQAGSNCFDVANNGEVSLVMDVNSVELCEKLLFNQIGEFVSAATLQCGAQIISWSAVGAADACMVTIETTGSMAKKRQGTVPMPGIVVAAANGDPHLSRPDGKTFDFKGQDNAIYSFFSSPTTMINVQMGKTMTNHFIKQVGVSFRGEFEVFTLAAQRGPQSYINRINRELNKVGGKARFPKHNIQSIIELELCQGHRVVLEKMVTKHGKRDNYFDIQVEVPGCHDDFDGALGQIYKCKYAEHKEKFVFDESMEEHYRVETLKSSFGLYNSTMATQPPCKQQIDAASTGPLSGASGHKN